MEYSVVIPVYHGAPYLDTLYERLTQVFKQISSDYEIIMVDDGSSDHSWEVMCRLRQRDAKVKLIQLTRNFGQHNATLCGFHHCNGDTVITLDDDLQHPPEEIPKLIAEIQKGRTLVYGQYQKKKHGRLRNWASAVGSTILAGIAGDPYKRTSFRAIQGTLVKKIQGFPYPCVIVDLWFMPFITRKDVASCEIRHDESPTSNYHFGNLFRVAVTVIFGHPRIASRIAALRSDKQPAFIVKQKKI